MTPMAMLPTIQKKAAPMTRERVIGAASITSGITSWPRLTKEVRSRSMKRRFIISAYWTGSGLSRPKLARTAATTSGEALRPAMREAGSEPGVAKKIRNTRMLMPSMTKIIWARRRMSRLSMDQRNRSLARGSSASRTPSPRMLRASTESTMAMPGAIATIGRV